MEVSGNKRKAHTTRYELSLLLTCYIAKLLNYDKNLSDDFCTLGPLLRHTVGEEVDAQVGDADGLYVGECIGHTDGDAVGLAYGALVGHFTC